MKKQHIKDTMFTLVLVNACITTLATFMAIALSFTYAYATRGYFVLGGEIFFVLAVGILVPIGLFLLEWKLCRIE